MSDWDEPNEPPAWEKNLNTQDRLGRIESLVKGTERTEITDQSGFIWLVPAEPIGRQRLGDGAWSLVSVGNGKFSIEPGDIYTKYGFEEDPLEILGRGLSFRIDDGTRVWLDLDMTDPLKLKLTLSAGKEWPGFPSPYKMSEDDDEKSIEHAYLKLWHFKKGDRTKRSQMDLGSGFYAEQFAKSPNCIILWGSHNLDTRGFESVFAPVLVPLT